MSKLPITDSCGNVFRDLNLPCADEKMEVVRLQVEIARLRDAMWDAATALRKLSDQQEPGDMAVALAVIHDGLVRAADTSERG